MEDVKKTVQSFPDVSPASDVNMHWLPAEGLSLATDLGMATSCVFSSELIPEFLEHLTEVTAPKPSSSAISSPRTKP